MTKDSQTEYVSRKCTAIVAGVIEVFPTLMTRCDAEVAASIVADLIKTHMRLHAGDDASDTDAALEAIIERACRDADKDK